MDTTETPPKPGLPATTPEQTEPDLNVGERRESTESSNGAIVRATPGTIFVSYRVRPDSPIAGALKTLFENTIDPKPRVFVSGIGGILPSEETSRAQMQSAAQAAGAFAAIITEHSKNREWIFFEAGAAWGRGVLYAPLLVGVPPETLPNTIQMYHATPYDDEGKVLELVREVASKLGATVRTRSFPNKHRAFASAVAEHLGLRRPSDDEGREHTIAHAIDLIFEDSEAANEILDDYASDNPAVRAEVRIMRIRWSPGLTNIQRLERLEASPELCALPEAKLCLAMWEPAPHLALKHAQEALASVSIPDGNAYQYAAALSEVTARLQTLGRTGEARALLRTGLRDQRRAVRAAAALRLAEELKDDKLARAALTAYAVASHPVAETLLAATRLMHSTVFQALNVHIARLADAKGSSPEAAHWLGLAFLPEGTQSLAYKALKRAGEGGLQLAYVNIANLFGRGKVPGAGLELLAAN